jgi:hypothetical protein
MRMRRWIAALAGTAALVTVCGCTVQTPDADGKPRSPVRIQVTRTPSADGVRVT